MSERTMVRWRVLATAGLGWIAALVYVTLGPGVGGVSARQASIAAARSTDPVARLADAVAGGTSALTYDGPGGYLRSVLDHLSVPVDSQLLVFSKTSLDAPYVSPRTPRAIYFNDDVTVALTPGAPEIEFTAVGPGGLAFYTLDVRRSATPRVVSRRDCAGCHQGVTTPPTPSLVMMSVFSGLDGSSFDFLPFEYADQRTPLDRRWGGWYVTGRHGALRHRGNQMFRTAPEAMASDTEPLVQAQNVVTLADRFETTGYLVDTSDIVALMTFEHQVHVTNAMLAALRVVRLLETPRASASTAATPEAVLNPAIEQLVQALLSEGARPLLDPVRGVSTFTETFAGRGPRDTSQRSLRDFDLETRLFRYPVSYMVHSELFHSLPESVREPVLRQLHAALTAEMPAAGPASTELRRAALEILRATEPSLPAYWRQ